jgi:hypothetical protein
MKIAGVVAFLFLMGQTSLLAQQCPGAPSNNPDPSITELMQDLTSDQWPRVWAAKLRLESRQSEAIPALLELLQSERYVELHDTWDLIYPGAKTFYGHGFIVDYDLDWLSVRAGWVLEELTFQDFGFSSNVIKHDELLQAVIAGKADHPLKEVVRIPDGLQQSQENRRRSVLQALDWWKAKGRDWTRLDAVIDALGSGSEARISRTVEWIFNGETRCKGFDRINMKRRILPAASRHKHSPNAVLRERVGRLLADWDKDWIYDSKNSKACY